MVRVISLLALAIYASDEITRSRQPTCFFFIFPGQGSTWAYLVGGHFFYVLPGLLLHCYLPLSPTHLFLNKSDPSKAHEGKEYFTSFFVQTWYRKWINSSHFVAWINPMKDTREFRLFLVLCTLSVWARYGWWNIYSIGFTHLWSFLLLFPHLFDFIPLLFF